MDKLRVTEIFLSLQGEAMFTGFPTVFIRTTGCPLRCNYCDTAYAFSGGQQKTFGEIISEVRSYGVKHVCVTGGEPLAQPGTIELMDQLVEEGFIVNLETSGALDISSVPSGVHKIVDLKTPDSGEEQKNLYSNLDYLSPRDQIKIVICSDNDYEWAKVLVLSRKLSDICEVILSPSYEQQDPKELAEKIIQDKLSVRFQIQMHKYLWGDEKGK